MARKSPFLIYIASALTSALAIDLPPGFEAKTLVEGITGATAMAISPDGGVFIAEQTGSIQFWKEGQPQLTKSLTLEVDSWWERGLLGIALDPAYPQQPYIYLYYTASAPKSLPRVSRFEVSGTTITPSSEKILFEGDDQQLDPKPSFAGGHQGGGITFGPDGKLYAAFGEHTTMAPSQDKKSLLGKIIRLNSDGSIPDDNPFAQSAEGKARAIYAYGLRNVWALSSDPVSKKLLANDVGASLYEEVNEIKAGQNYGWPDAEGPVEQPEKYTDPIFWYNHQQGLSAGGGCFYRRPAKATHPFPESFEGRYFLQEFMNGWMVNFDPMQPAKTSSMFGGGLLKPIAMAVAPSGDLLVLERNTWVKDKTFKEGQGRLTRIRYNGTAAAASVVSTTAWPTSWQSAPWKDAGSEAPDKWRFLEPRVEGWMPGFSTYRFLQLPVDQKATIDQASQELDWPKDTTIVYHFGLQGRKIRSQVIVSLGNDQYRAAIYKWDQTGQDATLVTQTEEVPVAEKKVTFAAPLDTTPLPPIVPGYFYDLDPANLRPNDWRDLVSSPEPQRWMARLDDTGRSLEDRVKTYLALNCANCHRPGGIGRGNYDARFSTPLANQNLLNGPLMSGDLGVAGAKAIVPGVIEQSMVWIRLHKAPGDPMRMPPASQEKEKAPLLPILEQWINSLK